MVRGIERTKIFRDNKDKDNFVKRLGTIPKETFTPCYAWSLLSNHVLLLLRPVISQSPLACADFSPDMRSPLIVVMGATGRFSKIVTNPFCAMRIPTFLRYQLKTKGHAPDALPERVAGIFGMETGDLYSPGKYRRLIEPSSVFCYWAVRELGETATLLAKRLGLTQAGVSKSVSTGEKVVKEMDLKLLSR